MYMACLVPTMPKRRPTVHALLGVTSRNWSQRPPLSRAVCLPRPNVFLEQFVVDQRNDPLDRLVAGHAVFCIHGRLRWSDSLWILNLTEDLEPDTGKGFLQCETLITKTATSAKKKSTFLPATSWHSVSPALHGIMLGFSFVRTLT